VPVFLAIRGPGSDGVVDAPLIGGRQDQAEHSPALCRTDHADVAFIGLVGDRFSMADFLHLLVGHAVAGHVANVPGVPDEAADDEHKVW
jgi:hypothetical protein